MVIMKKAILYTISILVLLTIIIAGFQYIRNQKQFEANSLDAVPINTEFIFQCNSISGLYSSLNDTEGIYSDIKQLKFLKKYVKLFKKIDTILKRNNVSIDVDKEITVATKLVGKENVDFLFIIKLDNAKELKSIKEIVNISFSNQVYKKKKYSGEDILIYEVDGAKYHVAYVDGLMLMSCSSLIIEDAIRQKGAKTNLLSLTSFQDIYKTMDKNSDARIFINNSNCSSIVRLLGNEKYSGFFSRMKNWGDWTGLDVDIDKSGLLLNGFSSSSNNKFELYDVLANQTSVETTLLEAIPSGVANFSILSLSNKSKYREDIVKYRGKLGRVNVFRRALLDLNDKFNCKFEDNFYSFFAGEAALLSQSVNSIDINANKISVVKTIGEDKVSTTMHEMYKSRAEKEKKSLSYYATNVNIDRDLSYTIYELPCNDIPYRVLGDLFYEAPSRYCVIVNNNLVFGGSIKILSEYLHALSLNKFIIDDAQYKESSKRFSDKGNFMFYANTVSSFSYLKHYLKDNIKRKFQSNEDFSKRFYSIGFQIASANSMVYNNLFVLYSEEMVQKPKTEWESGLDANVVIKPAVVKNHSTQETEIIVQDENNNIYLINSLGRILWKLPLEGRINSEIYQVDKYRNEKLQYLFSTNNRIYLIDRNGNNVERFPVRLKSPTIHGITVFDYDKNRNYRIFVPSEDKNIYLYNLEGNIQKGWNFKGAENTIESKVNHYRVGSNDYIVFKDKFKIYILDRRGGKRANTTKYLKLSNNEPVFVETKESYLIVSDLSASIYKVEFNGNISNIGNYKNISPQHLFTSSDLDNDGTQEYIFADKGKLEVYSGEDKIFDTKVDGQIKSTPSIYTFSSTNKLIGFVDSDNYKAYLVNKNGTNYSGFPVTANNPFSITFLRDNSVGFYMFVGSKDKGLYKYRVN